MNQVSFLLALRYLRASAPRSLKLYLIPLVGLVLVGALYGVDGLARRSQDPKLLGLHAEWARAIGNAKWLGWLAVILVGSFIATIRRLTIFTTISTYGMFLGCAALVVVMSVMSGFEDDIKRKILGTHAHVVVTRLDEAFTDWPERLETVAKEPGVAAVTPYLSAEAMIASSSNRSNVVVKGIDPATIGRVTDLSRNLELGDLDALAHPEKIKTVEPLPPRDGETADDDADLRLRAGEDARRQQEAARRAPPGILVGRELAKSLRIYLGDDVSMISPTGGIGPSGAVPKARPYRVAGIFYTGMFEYDSKFVYLTLPAAQKLFDQQDEVTGLELKIPDPDHTDALIGRLQARLGPGYEVADWKSLNRSLFSALALEKIVMFIFLSFIMLVAAFSIIANGQMIASQKMGEIAILKSMGATDGTIAGAFLLLGAMLGTVGVLAGVAGGLCGALALRRWGYALDPDVFYLTSLPVRLELWEVVAVAAAGIFITVAATVQPAWVAARMTPVEGLREGGH